MYVFTPPYTYKAISMQGVCVSYGRTCMDVPRPSSLGIYTCVSYVCTGICGGNKLTVRACGAGGWRTDSRCSVAPSLRQTQPHSSRHLTPPLPFARRRECRAGKQDKRRHPPKRPYRRAPFYCIMVTSVCNAFFVRRTYYMRQSQAPGRDPP